MFYIYLLDWHSFCVGIEQDSKEKGCDNSIRFLSKDTYIMTNIIRTVFATSLPTTENKKKFNSSLIAGG
jgi:hypothetical protein